MSEEHNNLPFLANMDDWYAQYETLSTTEEACAHFLDLLQKEPIGLGDWEESELNMVFGDLLAKLWEVEKKYAEAFALTVALKRLQPEVFLREYRYFADDQLEYAFFKKTPELALPAIQYFQDDPNSDIDLFLPFHKTLWYWLDTKRGATLVRETFQAIYDKCDEYFNEPHEELAYAVFYTNIQEVVEAWQQGGALDFSSVQKTAAAFKLSLNPLLYDHCRNALTQDWDIETARQQFAEDRDEPAFWLPLKMRFIVWMHRQGFPFYTTHLIFTDFEDYWLKFNENASTVEDYLSIQYYDLDKYLAQKRLLFLPRIKDIAACLWAVPFISNTNSSANKHALRRDKLLLT